jgi:Bacterial archaeo-eukaryotic release factor family 3
MSTVTAADLTALLATHEAPCVSVYLPTARTYPDSQQDPIRYRNLLDKAETTLRESYPPARTAGLTEKLRGLLKDDAFWSRRLDGLAVLGSPDTFRVFELNRPIPERVIVADSFHVKPLLRIAQSADRFHVLCLTREEVSLFEGNRDGLAPIRPGGVPWRITEALGGEPRQHKVAQSGGKSAGATQPHSARVEGGPGHAAQGDDTKLDAERFFRAVDRAVRDHVSRHSDLPLVVAALPEHQAMFRAVTHNQRVLPQGIERNPSSMSADQLRDAAWKCVEPAYLARLQRFVEDFNTARARQQASDDVCAVAKAAREGRVGVLLVEAERVVPGRLDPQTGEARPGVTDAAGDDLLDDVAETVLRMKGTVVVVPRDRMPTGTGLAATNRF